MMATESRPRAEFRRIDVERARQLLQDPDTLVLDVRDARAFSAGHIASALHVTSANVGSVIARTPRKTPILIYCYHGNSSQNHAQTFIDFGFRDVYSLDGGYEAWHAREPAGVSSTANDGAGQSPR